VKFNSLQGRLTLAATLTLGLWVVVLTIGFNLVLTNRLAAQADDVLRVRAEAVASTLTVSPSGLVTVRDTSGDAAMDRGIWIFQGRHLVEGPTPVTAAAGPARELATVGGQFSEISQPSPLRLYADSVMSNGRKVATVVATVELTPYVQARQVALLGSSLLAVLLLGGVFLVLRSAIARALLPVSAMATQAAQWSVADVAGRFGEEVQPRELAVLARNLDGLLDRLAALVRHEKQLVGELSHELRTPLSRITAETDLLRERHQSDDELDAGHASIVQDVEEMRGILDTLLATARTETGAPKGRCDAVEVARSLAARMIGSAPAKSVVVIRQSEDTYAGMDAAVLERALSPVLDNAIRYAAAEVRIEVTGGSGLVIIEVADDGPGIRESSLPHVFTPGRRADPADGHQGAGLGLALALRLLVASGGGISASSTPGGAVFHLTLPRG